jgi:hypothetical protein
MAMNGVVASNPVNCVSAMAAAMPAANPATAPTHVLLGEI